MDNAKRHWFYPWQSVPHLWQLFFGYLSAASRLPFPARAHEAHDLLARQAQRHAGNIQRRVVGTQGTHGVFMAIGGFDSGLALAAGNPQKVGQLLAGFDRR